MGDDNYLMAEILSQNIAIVQTDDKPPEVVVKMALRIHPDSARPAETAEDNDREFENDRCAAAAKLHRAEMAAVEQEHREALAAVQQAAALDRCEATWVGTPDTPLLLRGNSLNMTKKCITSTSTLAARSIWVQAKKRREEFDTIERQHRDFREKLALVKRQHRDNLAAADQQHQDKLTLARQQYEDELAANDGRHRASIETFKQHYEEELAANDRLHRVELAILKDRHLVEQVSPLGLVVAVLMVILGLLYWLRRRQ
ncbi:hypothetical protein B0T26DRAFT_745174 [Lasiosphaeria miniovina]|uniref:Uncharacterized protein n=1 Tax=Lasiosphaeria miniovina TaxID=1954250 RepID=A0AA40EF76_9PEZI|nr:uncharacterized protein B0T26DRAFT_745174 [Lasiosphaeria miniovina]KAK0733083.1 hypothetical protein B0T26DRAFT_745174 [Lasiosphaeria miniovina]